MPPKQKENEFLPKDRVVIPEGARKASSELPPTKSIEEHGQIHGIFLNMRVITINDTTTHQPKDVPCYTFLEPEDKEKKFSVLGGRVGLDSAFQDQAEDAGGFERLRGQHCVIERGTDTPSKDKKRRIGNYNVYFWDERS